MRKRIFCSLAAAIAVCVGGISPSVAEEEVNFASMSSYNVMETRLTEIEARLASLGGEQKGKGGDCGCDTGWCATCTTPGITLDSELLFVRAYSGDDGQQGVSRKYVATPRIAVGWVGERGIGVRVRGFTYESDNIPNGDDFDVSYGDFEITDKFQLGCWHGVLSGGARLGHYKEYDNPPPFNPAGLPPVAADFTGWGPVIAAELARPVRGNLYLFGSARYSALFGRDINDFEPPPPNAPRVSGSITELQLGTEYRRDMCGTNQMFVRMGWEAQYWSGFADTDEEDFGLVGFAFAGGITR